MRSHGVSLLQSGTGELIDDARGQYVTETSYDDLNVEQIKAIKVPASWELAEGA